MKSLVTPGDRLSSRMSFTRQYALRRPGPHPGRDARRLRSGDGPRRPHLRLALALGAYIGRNPAAGPASLLIVAFGCVIGLQYATARGREQLAIGLLFGLGLCSVWRSGRSSPSYAKADPASLYQAAGSTALFVAGLGAYGYATRRDLSSWYRALFWALIALIVFGLVTLFIAIPGANMIYAVLGLVVFGGFTIFDFNRLRRANDGRARCRSRPAIFLDIFNVFLFFLRIFGAAASRSLDGRPGPRGRPLRRGT